MRELIIDNDFKNLLPKLTLEQYTSLEDDIRKHGVLQPIITWKDMIVDGHNRYAICLANHIEDIPVKEIDFESRADAMQWMIDTQLSRRNLTKSQLVRAYEMYEAERAKEARERQAEYHGNQYGGGLSANLNEVQKQASIRTAADVAAKMGVSENTYRNMKLITKEGTPEQIERMNKGGRGNGVSTIAMEIKEKDIPEGMKRCSICGQILPLSDFYWNSHNKNYGCDCKGCHYQRKRRGFTADGSNKVPDEYNKVSAEEIISGLYNSDIPQISIADIEHEFKVNFDRSMDNIATLLERHSEIIKENNDIVFDMWQWASKKFIDVRESYVCNLGR